MLVDELAHEAARRLKLKYPQSEGPGSDRLRQRRTDTQPCMRPVEVSRRVGDCFFNVSRGRLMACALARGLPASIYYQINTSNMSKQFTKLIGLRVECFVPLATQLSFYPLEM